jgi:hypothetical protein
MVEVILHERNAFENLARAQALAGDARPWQPDAVNVLSDKLVFRPRLTPVA